MAPKRKSNEKVGVSYDSLRFFSVAEAKQYKKALNVVVRNCIPERGLEFGEHNIPAIVAYIEKRGWGNFCKEPLVAMDCIVRKFYTNAFEQKNGKTTVRGKTVKFNPSTINTFYGLAKVDDSAYRALEGEADYEKIISMFVSLG